MADDEEIYRNKLGCVIEVVFKWRLIFEGLLCPISAMP